MPLERAGALPETCCATLWLWPGRALYAGPSLGLDTHSGSVACLAVGVDAPFTVRTQRHPARSHRTALIAARLPHRLVATGERMAFCYFDPASARERSCRARMAHGDALLGHGHAAEDALCGLGERLHEPAAAARWLDLAGGTAAAEMDSRIAAATRRLRAEPERALSAAELAAGAGLSSSRFLHLFRQHTGTSFRRYRLWARMVRAGTLLAGGQDLTAAAAGAGFASPSHFSDSFRAMFGLPPSSLLAAGGALRIVVAAE